VISAFSLEKHALHNYLFVARRATGSTLGL